MTQAFLCLALPYSLRWSIFHDNYLEITLRHFLTIMFLLSAQLSAVTDADVAMAIDKLVERIKVTQTPDGGLGRRMPFGFGYSQGYTAINCLALVYAGLDESDPVVKKSVNALLKSPPEDVYSISVYMMLLAELDRIRYKKEIQEKANWLMKVQAANGTWDYRGTGPGDNSVTQFAILALDAARSSGVKIPKTVFDKTRKHYLGQQNKNGGWGYRSSKAVTASMTAAGLSSLSLCGEQLESSLEVSRGSRFIGKYQTNTRIQKSMDLFKALLKNQSNQVFSSGYTSYAFERLGIFFDRRYIAGVDWYRTGADFMIRNNFNFTDNYGDFFPLLFLAKGNIPLLMGKLTPEFGQRNTDLRRNDCRNMMKDLSLMLETRVDWEKVNLNKNNKSLGKLPLLYWSGYNASSLTENESELLKKFLEGGGTLVVAPALKSTKFAESALQELRKIYPTSVFENISTDHPLRHMFYDLRQSYLPLKVLTSYCSRHRVFILEDDFSIQYESWKVKKINRLTLANLARFALKEKPLLGRLVDAQLSNTKNKDKNTLEMDERDDAEGMQLAYLSYSGSNSADKKAQGLELMQAYFRQALKFPARREAVGVDLRDLDALQKMPFISFSGSQSFQLSQIEKANLKTYLENGGFVYAENTCSKPNFAKSLETLIKELFPKEIFEQIRDSHVLYNEPYSQKINMLGSAQNDSRFLKGLRLKQRYVLLLSPYDLSASISGGAENFGGPDSESAIRLLTNIISYALTY